MRNIFIGLLVLGTLGVAGAATNEIQSTNRVAPPALAGRFETVETRLGQKVTRQDWRLWRTKNRIETRNETTQMGEVWTRVSSNQMAHDKLFLADQTVLEYAPGELRAAQQTVDWDRLGGLVEVKTLARDFKPGGTTVVLGRTAQIYQRQSAAGLEVIWWLPAEQVAALIRRELPDRTVTTQLQEIYPVGQPPWTPGSTAGFRTIDYADLGDMESDPFVQKITRQLGHAHEHEHP